MIDEILQASTAGSPAPARMERRRKRCLQRRQRKPYVSYNCSFCGKNQDQVRR